MQHCSPSTFQVNFPGLQPSSIEIWVLQPPALQNQLSQVSFLGIFRATTPPHIFFGGYIFTFHNELVRSQEKKLGRFESFMFVVELLVNSAVVCFVTLCFEHAQQFHISHFSYHLMYYMIIDYCWRYQQCFNELH